MIERTHNLPRYRREIHWRNARGLLPRTGRGIFDPQKGEVKNEPVQQQAP